MNTHDLVNELRARGLAAERSSGPDEMVIGGRSARTDTLGITVYEQAFVVYRVPTGWFLGISRRQRDDLEMSCQSLEDVLRIVLREYGI